MAHKQHTRNSSGPAGPSQRQLRAGELIRHALVDILREEDIHDEALADVSVTVTEVRLSPDLKHATCFVEPLGAGVEASLDLSNGRPHIAALRPGDDARFFASRETFSVLHLCNHWTAGVLNAGGVAIRPVPAIASGEVMRSVRAAERARKLDRPPLRD